MMIVMMMMMTKMVMIIVIPGVNIVAPICAPYILVGPSPKHDDVSMCLICSWEREKQCSK